MLFQQRAGPAIQVVCTARQWPPALDWAAESSMRTVPLPSWRKAIRRPPTTRLQRSPGRSTSMAQDCQGPSPRRHCRGIETGGAAPWADAGFGAIGAIGATLKATNNAAAKPSQMGCLLRQAVRRGSRDTAGGTEGSLYHDQPHAPGASGLPRFNKPSPHQVPVFRARVQVSLRPSVLDPAGEATRAAAARLGVEGIRRLRIGKAIELELEAADQEAARSQLELLSDRLLANPVIENWHLDVLDASGDQQA